MGTRSARLPFGVHVAGIAVGLITGLIAGCGSSAPTPTVAPVVTPAPVPTATPDRHVAGPVDANRVFQILLGAGLPVHQESLGSPGPNGEPTATLYLVSGAEHIGVRQYSTPAAVASAGFRPGSRIANGDAPYEIWATNIVLDIGPSNPNAPPGAPDAALQAAALAVVTALDPYLGPLAQRAVTPVALPSPPASIAPASAAPSPPSQPAPSSS